LDAIDNKAVRSLLNLFKWYLR